MEEDYIVTHRRVYDALASEYEARNEDMLEVTESAVEHLTQYLPAGSSVLELGSGSGLAAKILSEAGFLVTAIDLSPEMIRIAQRISPTTKFIEGDFLTTDFTPAFDALFAFAFIHLFPKEDALKVLEKSHGLLKHKGLLYIGTTKDAEASEGWEEKADYTNPLKRYRKRWTEKEFEEALIQRSFEIIDRISYTDPIGKVWMDVIARKIS